ncbi:MAG TPA: hypothetical protein VK071_11345 [Tissierellales bacterium]|nr:hypothetical protein [Tissierellales bacterium]
MSGKKDVEDILNELENLNPKEEDLDKFRDMAEEYGDKSEKEIFFEIIQLNKEMEKNMNAEEYREMLEKLDSIKPLLNEEQLIKLDEILRTLGNE